MPQYRWRAIDLDHKEHVGVLWAVSIDQLENELIDQGLGLMHAERMRLGSLFDRFTDVDRLALFQQLRRLVGAGFLVPAALELIARQGRPLARLLAQDMARSVAGGLTLTQALQLWPAYFDEHVIAIVRSGQDSGALDAALDHACLLLQARVTVRKQVLAAIAMPLATLGFFVASVLVILLVVVPQFEHILALVPASAKPPSTSFLFGISRALRALTFAHVFWGCVAIVIVYFLLRRMGVFQKIRLAVGINASLVRRIASYLSLSLFFQATALLLAGGKSLVEAVNIASVGTPPGFLRVRLQQFARDLAAGGDIGQVYTQALGPLADPEVEALLVTGCAAGLPGPAIEQVARIYAERSTQAVARLAFMVQPVLMLSLGLLVGVLVYSVYVPLAQLPASFDHLY